MKSFRFAVKFFGWTLMAAMASLTAVPEATAQHAAPTAKGANASSLNLTQQAREEYNLARGLFAVAGQGNQSESSKVDQAVRDATRNLKDAESDEDKRQAEREMEQALDAQYDFRLNEYEKHLDELEANLKLMREQLAKKRDAKSEMVSLKLQMMKYEADDLGWPSRSRHGNLGFGSGMSEFPFATGARGLAPRARLKTSNSGKGVK